MGARQKLNAAYVNGALIISGILGYVCQSFAVFLIAFVIILASEVTAGDIRSGPKR